MNHITVVCDELRRNISHALIPLQTSKQFDEKAFESLSQSAIDLATTLKGIDLVSKSLLNELHTTIRILQAEAPYMGEHISEVTAKANQLQMIFDLILLDESYEDRMPDTPRII